MSKMLGTIVVAGRLLVSSANAFINWYNLPGDEIYNSNGTTMLFGDTFDSSLGCFVQLIYAGADGTIDPAEQDFGTGTTDDDTVVGTSWIGSNYFGEPPDGVVGGESYYGTPGIYYVRCWNNVSPNYSGGQIPTTANLYYGNSSTFNYSSVPTPEMPVDFDFASGGSWSTTTPLAIPEPTFVALALMGLVSIRFFRRK